MSREKVLVTGATGFLGRHVLEALAAGGTEREVVVLVRRSQDWHALDYAARHDGVAVIEGGLTGDVAWQEDPRLEGLTGLIHLAAVVCHSRRDPAPLMRTNVEGTQGLVELAGRTGARMVFVSSSGTVACHRRPGAVVYEEAPYVEKVVGTWPYYASKVEAERRARALAAERGVALTIMRPPVLLGPGDHRFRSTGHVIRFLRGRLPFLIDGGISFCDVRDTAAAVVEALAHPARRPVYHLPGHDMTIGEFFGLCQAVSGVPAPTRYLPYGVARYVAGVLEAGAHALGKHSPLPDPVVIEMARHHWGIATRHADHELGYRVRDARETLTDTVEWLRKHHPDVRG